MPISCNAVGDIIALVQLGIKIAEVLNESRKAPADCRALCNDLRSLERLIALSRPTIDGIQDRTLRELVEERLDGVSRQILDGLKLICNFDAAFDASSAHIERNWRQNLRHWGKMSKESLTWVVKRSGSARDARVAIAQSFTSLVFALLVAFQADQRGLFKTLCDAHDASITHLNQLAQDLTTRQDDLSADISEVKSLFEKLIVELDSVREEVAGISERLERNLARTQLDVAAVRQQLNNLQTTVATATAVERVGAVTRETVERVGAFTQQTIAEAHESIERLEATFRQGFTVIEARFTSGSRHQDYLDQLTAPLMENPLTLVLAQFLYSQTGYRLDSSANHANTVEPPSQALVSRLPREIASPPVIVGIFLLALRANTGNERAAYATLAFLLFLASKMLQLYKTPLAPHVVFVVDMFNVCVEITFSDAISSESLHRALVNHFNGRLGHVLLRKRRYELRYSEKESQSSQSLHACWEGLLMPGDRISMDALVQKPKDETVIVCPACSTWIADRSREEKVASWMKCPYCPATVRLSDSVLKEDEPGRTDQIVPNEVEPHNQSHRQIFTSGLQSWEKTREQERANEEAALRQCRRIHVLESVPRRRFSRASSFYAALKKDIQDPQGSPSSTQTRSGPFSERKIACYFCRHRKLRCDGVRPVCGNCTRRSNVCGYDELHRKRGPNKIPGNRKKEADGKTGDGNGPGVDIMHSEVENSTAG